MWIEVMGLLHDSDIYGVLHWNLSEIAQALGAPMKVLKELVSKGVLYGVEKGTCEPMIYTPKSGRVEGDAVTLVEAQQGPVWYSPRMVRDEYVRTKRGASTRFGEANNHSPMGGFGEWQGDAPNAAPKSAPHHWQGDGASSSSSSSKIGSSSTRVPTDGEQTANALAVVMACKALRRLGMLDVQPQRPELLDLVARGTTTEQMAMTAAEITLRQARKAQIKCLMTLDPEPHPELLELFASGATAEQMYLRPADLAELKTYTPNLKYLAATLIGRANDQQGQEDSNGNHATTRNSGPAGTGGKLSAVERVKAANAAAEKREQFADTDARLVG